VPLIQIKGLTKLYRMGDAVVHALDGVDLEIERGEFVAITGPSGSGKSTVMHLLGCLDRPTAGEYLLDGQNVSGMSDRELARIRNQDIGFVFQTFNLINRTSALENVGIPLFYARTRNSRGPARRALERVGLTPRSTHTPSELSGGERQRVAIARAIVNDPLLLLADEPTGNLDTRTGEQIMEIFRSLNEQGVTIVLVTHERDVAMRTNRIVQMLDGKIVLDKPTRDMRGPAAAAPVARPAGIPSAQQAHMPEVALRSTETAPDTQSSEAAPMAEVRPRLAAGANGALGCGLAAPVFLMLAFVAGVLLGRMRVDPSEFGPDNPPPLGLLVLALLWALCYLLAIVGGFIGVFWGRAVLRRIRTVPGVWIGKGRARVGWICGLVTVLIPVCLLTVNVIVRMARLGRG
jgi:putative ABC transport system ATP-binding protein